MKKTVFNIQKMDCASEEQMIRMKLSSIERIHDLQFDLGKRTLEVRHNANEAVLFTSLQSLNLGASLVSSSEVDELITTDYSNERKLLRQVLAINFLFFLLEVVTGFLSHSMGLVADSLDMLADALVYAMALFAVGGTLLRKKNIAKASGYFQMFLSILGFIEVLRRFLGYSESPVYQTMIIVSLMALIGNALSLYLLQKSKSKDAHMQASMIFTSNDVLVNIGVILAGVLVYLTHSKWPDLIIGICVFALVARGSYRILQLGK